MRLGGIRVREPGASDWRQDESWPQKLLAGFLKAQDLLQSVSHVFIQQTLLQILGAKA